MKNNYFPKENIFGMLLQIPLVSKLVKDSWIPISASALNLFK